MHWGGGCTGGGVHWGGWGGGGGGGGGCPQWDIVQKILKRDAGVGIGETLVVHLFWADDLVLF